MAELNTSSRGQSSGRSVLVLGIPPSVTKVRLTIHFQKRVFGGGDVETVVFPFDKTMPDGAIVTFQKEQVLETVFKYPHRLLDAELTVVPLPQIFSTVEATVGLSVTQLFSTVGELKSYFRNLSDEFNVQTKYTTEVDQKVILEGTVYNIQKAHRSLFLEYAKRSQNVKPENANTGASTSDHGAVLSRNINGTKTGQKPTCSDSEVFSMNIRDLEITSSKEPALGLEASQQPEISRDQYAGKNVTRSVPEEDTSIVSIVQPPRHSRRFVKTENTGERSHTPAAHGVLSNWSAGERTQIMLNMPEHRYGANESQPNIANQSDPSKMTLSCSGQSSEASAVEHCETKELQNEKCDFALDKAVHNPSNIEEDEVNHSVSFDAEATRLNSNIMGEVPSLRDLLQTLKECSSSANSAIVEEKWHTDEPSSDSILQDLLRLDGHPNPDQNAKGD
ncbi:uncharacterized protein LOC106165706 [Lingula anatina]|uniref:Uncharacterized protein LOC106165706 n=1 Tax=Lingula anatina TaxID=7574 RepID=A0A1S3IPK4_LINAN|nr:uncharacterized protein LOC106165706 [Lingula anatina]|eukprot:XP_013399474.1 uncharacterized protein LOC106165706 [Lingula anatina]